MRGPSVETPRWPRRQGEHNIVPFGWATDGPGRNAMVQIGMLRRAALAVLVTCWAGAAAAQDTLKIAVGQRGGWEQCVSELGQNAGFFKKHGLALDVLYTQGSGETLQSVISASVDVGIGTGTHALLSAYAKGAPVRAIGSSFTSADDQF